ncbi:hypothetical protein Tco_1091703 [Tanacetum coccineum]|uniref:Uncharacterized protein n=1 Tax=Tanacetum coccineum TaxID=301880 RepID=A0ABQ5I7S6_9ASTR
MVKPIWNNAQRVNPQNVAKKTHPCAKKNMVPRVVLMKSVSINIARQVNAAYSKTTLNAARPMLYLSKTAHSAINRPIYKNTSFKNSNIDQRVNTGNPQMDLQDQGVIDSGCSSRGSYNIHQLNDWYSDIVHTLAWVFEEDLYDSFYPNLVSLLESDLGKSMSLPQSLEKLLEDSLVEVEVFEVLILSLLMIQCQKEGMKEFSLTSKIDDVSMSHLPLRISSSGLVFAH